ncbi:MAG: sugar phosphate nucleotidyltransferase [Candidatus Nanogingivalis sp.]
MRKKIEDLIVIIPAAGIGTRGYPATLEIAKELITLPFEGYLQNSIVVLIEKLVQAGISAQNIAIVISPEKTSIKSIFESKKSIIEELRSKGKHNFAEKVERVEFLAPAKFIQQNCAFYGNQAPLSTPEVIEFIGESDFAYFFPDDNFATVGKNEFEQIFEAYEKFGGSILPVKQVQDDVEYSKYAIVVGEIIHRPRDKDDNLVLEVEKIDEKPGFENAKSELASVRGAIFENKLIKYMSDYAKKFDGNGELMYQIPVQNAMNNGMKFHAVRINGLYCDTGNCYDYALAVPAMMMASGNRDKYIKDLKEVIKYFESL